MYDLTIHGLFVFLNKLEILLKTVCSKFSVISSLLKTKIQWAQHVGVSSFQLHLSKSLWVLYLGMIVDVIANMHLR